MTAPYTPDPHDQVFDRIRQSARDGIAAHADATATRAIRTRQPSTSQIVSDVARQGAKGLGESALGTIALPLAFVGSRGQFGSGGRGGHIQERPAGTRSLADVIMGSAPVREVQGALADTQEDLDRAYGRPTTDYGRGANLLANFIGSTALTAAVGPRPGVRPGARTLTAAQEARITARAAEAYPNSGISNILDDLGTVDHDLINEALSRPAPKGRVSPYPGTQVDPNLLDIPLDIPPSTRLGAGPGWDNYLDDVISKRTGDTDAGPLRSLLDDVQNGIDSGMDIETVYDIPSAQELGLSTGGNKAAPSTFDNLAQWLDRDQDAMDRMMMDGYGAPPTEPPGPIKKSFEDALDDLRRAVDGPRDGDEYEELLRQNSDFGPEDIADAAERGSHDPISLRMNPDEWVEPKAPDPTSIIKKAMDESGNVFGHGWSWADVKDWMQKRRVDEVLGSTELPLLGDWLK